MILIDTSWENVKQMRNYKSLLGEEIILQLLERGARPYLGFSSVRSERFTQVCDNAVELVDALVSFIGPHLDNMDPSEIKPLQDQADEKGFPAPVRDFFAVAVSASIMAVAFPVTSPSDLRTAWRTVLQVLMDKMVVNEMETCAL